MKNYALIAIMTFLASCATESRRDVPSSSQDHTQGGGKSMCDENGMRRCRSVTDPQAIRSTLERVEQAEPHLP